MNSALQIMAIVILALIVYQDLKHRAVSWYLFAVGTMVLSIFSIKNSQLITYMEYFVINWIFIFTLLSMVSLYVLVKYKTLKNFFSGFFGIGDVLFLVMVSFAMSPGNYILFTIASLLFSLLAYMVIKLVLKSGKNTVPLAGLQAIFLVIVLIISLLGRFNMLDDYFVYDLFSKTLI